MYEFTFTCTSKKKFPQNIMSSDEMQKQAFEMAVTL